MTILAILEVLGGILLLFGALGMFAIGAVINSQDLLSQLGTDVPQWFLDLSPWVFVAIGAVMLIFAIVAFVLAWGFLKGKKWAWILGVIFAVLQIISGVFSLITSGASGIISLVIPILILVYLMMASTKAWFNQ